MDEGQQIAEKKQILEHHRQLADETFQILDATR